MKCPDCEDGKVKVDDNFKACFFCNGSGELCDRCGEATDEPGQNICDDCQADEEADA